MPDPVVSIIIPVFERAAEANALLQQLDGQTFGSFEALIVDDGSWPPVAERTTISGHLYPIRIVRHERQGGIARARNTGIQNSSADLLLFLDSDCILTDAQWLQKHIQAQEDSEEPSVIHGKVIGIHSTYAGHADGYSNWFLSCQSKSYIARNHHLPANNSSVPRAVFEKIGLFDEACRVAEDVEWSFRCLAQGVPLLYRPEMAVGHHDRESWRALWRHYYRFGEYALVVRKRLPRSPFEFLFPNGRIAAIIYLLPLAGLMTAYIVVQWLRTEWRVLYYIPGLLFANIAYGAGILHYCIHRECPD